MKNKIALVTGGTSGIGKAVAMKFASAGAKVIITGRNILRGEAALEDLNKHCGDATFIKADMSVPEDIHQLFSTIQSSYGRLDFACNNAGTDQGTGALTADIAEEDFDIQLRVNLKAVWLCMKSELNMMRSNSAGAIVNISSINGLGGTPGAAAYSSAKHALIGLSKSAALEYASDKIRINVVCPGMFNTPMLARNMTKSNPTDPNAVKSHFEKNIPLARIGDPEEIANAVIWLCSDHASFVTGHTMVVDGGMTVPFR
ncbi:SDR family NAD(P)-dependent oxidoreductase [Dyadobacter arcticus]|uniref:NAD(P)-dependent dehydrogenase (Short-subunit alcohol dehydrogenase family) n=1 Tax=Dyadobacter arcticus TaxID=1078754 RepID=A0ABX0UNI6_9BACT|nr:glucose 1-dehydrogenase [Dyadobacter arcticus]NIJ54556.1 NAD(P)-dependent dehydrogenase (short-subunit alcohol dehydrogenase family) [Dyadobacter arcticus]